MRESFTLRAAACGRTGDSARSTVPPVISHSPLNLSLPRAKAHGVQGPIFFSSTVALVVVGITVAVTPSTPQHSSVSVRQLALQRVPGRVALRLIGDGDADAGRRDVRASATYVLRTRTCAGTRLSRSMQASVVRMREEPRSWRERNLGSAQVIKPEIYSVDSVT